jgi:syndecan 1
MSADHGEHSKQGQPDGHQASRFDVVVRGYDRRQVDEHVAGLERTIARQRAELEQARAAQRPGGVFDPGGGHPVPARGDAGLTPDMISAFSSRLQSILQAAEDEAEDVRSKARNFAKKEEDAGRARLAELERRREAMLAELGKVRSQLDGLLNTVGKEPPIGASLRPVNPPEGVSVGGRAESTARVEPGAGGRPEPGRPEVGRPEPGRPEVGRPEPSGSRVGTLPGGEGRIPGSDPGQLPGRPPAAPAQQSPPTAQPKPRPSPSPRPRPTPGPGPAHSAVNRGTAEEVTRNGVLSRENGAAPGRGDEPDGGRSGFGGPH